ncbi:hypothetical protein HMPREF3196_00831 [Bifidobacterium bifidum]|uniref:Uncharacterized protein n=1 Tax=Bifidobacterium bifidum TaxID=1681 RepID=A0A133KQ49_BIFBI|nr:hypothetical protein HMPREF3196_00831 [Bifidobacterium bifidum]
MRCPPYSVPISAKAWYARGDLIDPAAIPIHCPAKPWDTA